MWIFFTVCFMCFLLSLLTQFFSYLEKFNTKFKFLKEMKTQRGSFLNTAFDSAWAKYPG